MTDPDEKIETLADSIRRKVAEKRQGLSEDPSDANSSQSGDDYDTFDDRYEIGKQIAEDEISTIYDAKHLIVERDIIIRLLKSQFKDDKEVQNEFMEQAKALVHGTITSPYGFPCDFGKTSEGISYIVFDGDKHAADTKQNAASSLSDLIRAKIVQLKKNKNR